jgi:hypothetical protein
MDAARRQAEDALSNSPGGVPFWIKVVTHVAAFGLGMAF